MDLDALRTLYSYDRWATARLLQASQQLSPAAFTQDLHTSHRSVRGTLVHTLWSEWIWLQRWQGTSPRQVFTEDQFPDLAAVRSRWAQIEHDRQDFVAGLTEDRLAARIGYENLRGERCEYSLRHMMQHVLNHSTFHRGQVVALLRQLGQTPPATDFLVFVDESRR